MPEQGRKQFTFQVDSRPIHTELSAVTGAQVRELGGIPSDYQLFLEGQGNDPDTPVSDTQTFDLHGAIKKFFAVPPATFGVRNWTV